MESPDAEQDNTFDGTVKELKRFLVIHKLPTTGKKDVLRARCIRHSTRCYCRLQPPTDRNAPQAATSAEPLQLEHILKVVPWSSSLVNWPEITISMIHKYKASDKHLKEGYNLFKCNKVENLAVGSFENAYYAQARVAPSMKKQRYKCIVKLEHSDVTHSECTCPAGQGKCKHILSVLFLLTDLHMTGATVIPETLACTSQPRAWGKASAKPVDASDIADFSALAPRVVCHDPDNPSGAISQSLRVERQLVFSSLPATAADLHITRKDVLTARHPFWRAILSEKDTPNSLSLVKTEPKLRNPR